MTFQIREPGELLSAEQLAMLESELGARLPEQYRQFLVANNGGVPHPNVTVDIEGLAGTPTDVQEFFSIGLKIESSNITWHLREVSERLPKNSVPIACDSGGNLFCLFLCGEHAGRVIYVDFGENALAYRFVADTFDAFLAKLR